MDFAALRGENEGAMKTLWLAVALTLTATLAHAEDMAEMISQAGGGQNRPGTHGDRRAAG
jgi:hypothetical protein